GEHVALPQVQLSAALVDGRGIRNVNGDALDGAVNGGTGEVASETNNVRGASRINSVRLQHRAAKDGTNGAVVVACIREERIRTGAGVLGEANNTLKLGCNQPVRQVPVCLGNSLKRGGKVLDGVGSINSLFRRTGQNIKVRTGRGTVDDSRVELPSKRGREAAGKLRIQGRQITTELIRERLNDGQLVRGHALRANGSV